MLLFSLWIWKQTKHSGSSGVDRRDISHKIIFYYIFPVQVSKKVKFCIYTCVCVVVFNYHLIILVLSTFEGGMSSSSREVNTRIFFKKRPCSIGYCHIQELHNSHFGLLLLFSIQGGEKKERGKEIKNLTNNLEKIPCLFCFFVCL